MYAIKQNQKSDSFRYGSEKVEFNIYEDAIVTRLILMTLSLNKQTSI